MFSKGPFFILISFLFLIANSLANLSPWDPTSIGVQFVENKGQWDEEIKFKTKLPGGELYLAHNLLSYRFYNDREMGQLLMSSMTVWKNMLPTK